MKRKIKNKEIIERKIKDLTHEEKVRINLWLINQNIKFGTGFICSFILVLIATISLPELRLLFGIIAVLGYWAIIIALIICGEKDEKYLKNKIKQMKNAK